MYPEGFTRQTNDGQVEVVGPYSGSGHQPGLGWWDARDAQGRTAQDVANEDAKAVGGLDPPRSTVMLGGEEAPVLYAMPGQDAVRKAYIVHGGKLYTLTFSPCRPENTTANTRMETVYASVTSSWVWMSSGKPCPAGNCVLISPLPVRPTCGSSGCGAPEARGPASYSLVDGLSGKLAVECRGELLVGSWRALA